MRTRASNVVPFRRSREGERDPNFWKKVAVVMLVLDILVPGCLWLSSASAAVPRVDISGKLDMTGQVGEGYYALGQVIAIMVDERTETGRMLRELQGSEVRLIIEKRREE
jgi:hypothetical protein